MTHRRRPSRGSCSGTPMSSSAPGERGGRRERRRSRCLFRCRCHSPGSTGASRPATQGAHAEQNPLPALGDPPITEFPFRPTLDRGRKGNDRTRTPERSGGRRAADARAMTRASRSTLGGKGSLPPAAWPSPRGAGRRAAGHNEGRTGTGHFSNVRRIRAADSARSKPDQYEGDPLPPRPRSRYSGLKRRAEHRRVSPSRRGVLVVASVGTSLMRA